MNKIFIKIGILLTLVILGVSSIDLNLIEQHINLNILLAIIIVQPVVILSIMAAGKRLSILSGTIGYTSVKFSTGFKATIISYGAGLLLPVRISEFLKPVYIRNQSKISLSAALTAIFLERVSDMAILGLFACYGAIYFLDIDLSKTLFLTGFLMASIYFSLRAEQSLIHLAKLIPSLIWRNFVIKIIQICTEKLRQKSTYIAFLYGLVAWALSFINVIIFLKFLGIDSIGMRGYIAIFLGSTIGGAVPALPGGFGTYEASVAYILKGYGFGLDESLVIALSLHISQLVFSVLGTLFLATFEKLGISSLMREVTSLKKKNIEMQ